MIKILHVIDKLTMDGKNPSSCARLFAEWIPRHDKTQFLLKVVSLRARDKAGEYLEENGIDVHYINKGKLSFANIQEIEKLIKQFNIDIIHLHGYSSANFGRVAAHKQSIQSVMHEHAILKVQPHQFLVDKLLRQRTDTAVAVSKAVKHFMMNGRSVPAEKINVIWNGINTQNFSKPDIDKAEEFRSQFVKSGQKLIGTVTRFRKEKGNTYFIEAAQYILRVFKNTHFVLIGDGPERQELEALVARLQLQDRIHFVGFVKNVSEALAAFDVAVIPSIREGFGLALAEAMAAARPIVASKVGGMVEMAQDKEHVLFVPPADSQAIAESVIRILDNNKLAIQLGKAACVQSEKFGIDRNVQELESLYTSMVKNGKISATA